MNVIAIININNTFFIAILCFNDAKLISFFQKYDFGVMNYQLKSLSLQNIRKITK